MKKELEEYFKQLKSIALKVSITVLCILFLFSSIGDAQDFTSTIENPEADNRDAFGDEIVKLENQLVVSAPRNNGGGTDSGSIYFFDLLGNLLKKIDHNYPRDQFGSTLGVLDNSRLIVGAPLNDQRGGNSGAVYIYDQLGNLVLTILNPENDASGTQFGTAIAGSSKHVFLVSSVGGTPVSYGKVFEFSNTGQLIKTLASPDTNDGFGRALAYLEDKDQLFIVVGAPNAKVNGLSEAGKVYIYGNNGSLIKTIIGEPPEEGSHFGFPVVSFGNKILIGARDSDLGARAAGRVDLYDVNGTNLKIFSNPEPKSGDSFGRTISILEETTGELLIGARKKDVDNGSGRCCKRVGKAYKYTIDSSGNYIEPVKEIDSPEIQKGGFFSDSMVGFRRDNGMLMFAIGAPGNTVNTLDRSQLLPGKVYLFQD